MAVIGYRRVSSADQSLDRQDLGPDVTTTFQEKLSGKDRDRPQLAAALAYCRAGDTFRVCSVDRLARSVSDLLAIVKELTDKGARVEILSERLVLDPADPSPQSEFQLQIWGAFAQYERAIIRARQAEGIELAKAKGGVYKGRQPALSPEEVRAARQRHADGVSLARLMKDYGVAKSTLQAALAGSGVYGKVSA